MGAVQLDPIKADLLGRFCSARKSIDHVANIAVTHGLAHWLACRRITRWPSARQLRVLASARTARHAHMPELRHDFAASSMNFIHHIFPTGQRRFPMKQGHIDIIGGHIVIDRGAFGNDQANTAFGATAIIGRNVGPRHPIR